ncbi:uncharacterized protein TRAVEDRAFT_19196 [Trametes versicolor FP-101664 SS1]|uniref:uncharacterized protein n=1 Tax=Trametes versicolor (strain FP-101664) TaxID=717944 RepID=UPI00046245F6|nr:uncharacterized protein TRAVEDRAFT_19196 [Trametes versicolor FP-101664 SS1]EIW60536.1 hypothetical protein TRAVEDRAFT_19196 [Trametes versicolor FP-101664 SS1]
MSMFSTLPPELHSDILSRLGQRDLLKCATVCRAWTEDSRRYLCAYPVINGARSAQGFKAYLQQSPRWIPCVKGLWLRALNNNRNQGNPDPWMSAALIELAPFLPNLGALTFENWGPVVVGPELIAALRSFEQVATLDLQAPVFHSSTDLEDFVFALPKLSSLRLHNVFWRQPMGDSPLDKFEHRGRPLPLTKLQLCGVYADQAETLFRWLRDHGCRPSELVALHIHEWDHRLLFDYMSFIGDKLEVFKFWPFFLAQEDPDYSAVTLALNSNIRSLSMRTNGSPGGYQNSWVPELLRSAEQCPLEYIAFEMCLDHEGALEAPLWRRTTGILESCWPQTLCSIAFVHEPVKHEGVYLNNFLQDGTPAFKRYFATQLEHRETLRIEMRNAPVFDLGVYNSDE